VVNIKQKLKNIKKQPHLLFSLNNQCHTSFFQLKDNWRVPVTYAASTIISKQMM